MHPAEGAALQQPEDGMRGILSWAPADGIPALHLPHQRVAHRSFHPQMRCQLSLYAAACWHAAQKLASAASCWAALPGRVPVLCPVACLLLHHGQARLKAPSCACACQLWVAHAQSAGCCAIWEISRQTTEGHCQGTWYILCGFAIKPPLLDCMLSSSTLVLKGLLLGAL